MNGCTKLVLQQRSCSWGLNCSLNGLESSTSHGFLNIFIILGFIGTKLGFEIQDSIGFKGTKLVFDA